jgi:hypothetical protein
MTQPDFLRLLLSIDFPTKYWALCDRYPRNPQASYRGQKAEVVSAFQELDAKPRYDSRDRSYEVEGEVISGLEWSALFVMQRSGPKFMMSAVGPSGTIGSNFAVLAYDAKVLEDPTFSRSPFSGPAPYPRPDAASPEALRSLIRDFIVLVREIKVALQTHPA